MTARKLVSIVTGTWNRHALLRGVIRNVREQTYRPLEHIIVSDGPDPRLAAEIEASVAKYFDLGDAIPGDEMVPIRFVELGKNWSTFIPNSFSAAPFLVAQLMARGEYQMWLSDDERMLVPDHIEGLVDLIEQRGVDFAYPMVSVYRDGQTAEETWSIGTDPPMHGTVTHALYKTELLKVRRFTFEVGSGTDWDQFHHWIASGAKWAFRPEVTLSHRIDH